MTEEKIRYVIYLSSNFFLTCRAIMKVDFKSLTLLDLNIFFTILMLKEDDFQLIQEVCVLVERLPEPDEITKKKFYYCLAKIKLYTEDLSNPCYLDNFLLLERHMGQLSSHFENTEDSETIENFQTLYAKAAIVRAGFDIRQTSNKFDQLRIYFESRCPGIGEKLEVELERHLSQKTNLQSCSMAARLN